jgi:hypothetical protein
MSYVDDAIARDNQGWQKLLGTLQSDAGDVIHGKVKAAIEDDKAWWLQRVAETSLPAGNPLQPDFFRMDHGDSADIIRPQNTVILDVCHNGVPAVRRFNAGPPDPP